MSKLYLVSKYVDIKRANSDHFSIKKSSQYHDIHLNDKILTKEEFEKYFKTNKNAYSGFFNFIEMNKEYFSYEIVEFKHRLLHNDLYHSFKLKVSFYDNACEILWLLKNNV
jgi:hypothetical protein